jgi:HSP20 family protein
MALPTKAGNGTQLERRRPTAWFEDLRREIDGVFEGFEGEAPGAGLFGAEPWTPRVDVRQEGGELVVKADLPGVPAEQIEVLADDDTLTIRGERTEEEEKKGETWWRRETRRGAFTRRLRLPRGVKPEAIRARYHDGVLEVRMPAAEAAAGAKRIPVGT